MDKSSSASIDWIKLFALLVSLAGLIWGGATYLLTRQAESRKPYLEMQLELYKSTSRAMSRIATNRVGSSIREKSMADFHELRWGELNLVTDTCVERLVSRFADELKKDSSYLRTEAYCAENEMRTALADSWNVQDWNLDRSLTDLSCKDQIAVLRKVESEQKGVFCGITGTQKPEISFMNRLIAITR